MTIWRATASAMRPSFSAGGRTRSLRTAATISSRLHPLSSWRRCSGPERLGDVLEIDANAIPRGRPAAHLIDQHVGRLEQLGDFRILLFPCGQAGQRFLLVLSLADFNQRILLGPEPRF